MERDRGTLGYRLRQQRRFAGLTQRQLGERIGIASRPAQRIGQWESGYRIPDEAHCRRIEQTLGLSEGSLSALRVSKKEEEQPMNNEVLKAIYDRRSVRKYQDRPVEKEKLEALVDAACHSPSARNLQPWHFTVIEDGALIGELEDGVRKVESNPAMRVFHSAPVVIMVSGHSENRWNQLDCGMATENLLLAAHSLGLGTCVIGFVMRYLDQPEAAGTLAKLNLPEGYTPVYGITVGYPDESPDARPRENKVNWL